MFVAIRRRKMCCSYLIVTSTAAPRKSHDWHETRGDQNRQNEAYIKTPGCKAPLSVTSIASSPTHNDDQVTHWRILTGPESVPYELPGGGVVTDLETTQEEAHTIILQQVDS